MRIDLLPLIAYCPRVSAGCRTRAGRCGALLAVGLRAAAVGGKNRFVQVGWRNTRRRQWTRELSLNEDVGGVGATPSWMGLSDGFYWS